MDSQEIRRRFLKFFESRGHKIVPSSSLIPTDPSVLLTTAGMQQFKPYFTGEKDPQKDFGSLNTVSIQKSFRTSDIDEVGDESHLTFFEMLGNFSFGGYFKSDAIKYAYEFITKELGLTIDYVSVFQGDSEVPADTESEKIWRSLGITDIRKAGRQDNFWGPTGAEGPCGPTTEIYIGGVEIWNIVFNEYYMKPDKSLEQLQIKGVDTGMGLERLAVAVQKKNNVFETDLFRPIISKILSLAGIVHESNNIPLSVYPRGNIGSNLNQTEAAISLRVITDHIRATTFLIVDGVIPSNKDRGYILRRLIRRIILRGKRIGISKIGDENFVSELAEVVIKEYSENYPELTQNQSLIFREINNEEIKFRETLVAGLRKIEEYVNKKEKTSRFARRDRPDFGSMSEDYINFISSKDAFDLYQTYGFPPELLNEELARYGMGYHKEEFEAEFRKHQEISRAGAEKKFGGHGMVEGDLTASDAAEMEIKTRLHTATHLLNAALHQVLGDQVAQRGSDITAERTRFDFVFDRKMTPEEIKKVENLVNQAISADYPVVVEVMGVEEAKKSGALFFYQGLYPDQVKVYTIGPSTGSGRSDSEESSDSKRSPFSRELCGGPHIKSTSEIGKFRIIKEEASSAGIRRIRAVVE